MDNLTFGTPEPFVLTDANGEYVFTDLTAGEYIVREIVPDGYVQTSPGAEGDFYFAVTRGSDELLKIDAATGEVTHIGPHNAGTDLHGLVRTTSGDLFAISGFTTDRFWSLNPDTGEATLIGPTGGNVGFGLAYDSATDTIYGVGQLPDGSRGLLTFDRTTGQRQFVSTTGFQALSGTSGVAFDPDQNRILGYNFSDGRIYSFNPDGTGQVLSQTTAGLGINLSFLDGELVMARFPSGTGSQLIAINPDTGAIRNLNQIQERITAETLEFVDLEPFAHLVTLAPGQAVSGLDFGNQRAVGEIHGSKFEDLDGDGVRDPGEGPLAGVTIYLDQNDNGQLDIGGTVEPDDFAPGTQINEAVPGVTLTGIGASGTPIFGGVVQVFANANASTGSNVFGNAADTWFAAAGCCEWTSISRWRWSASITSAVSTDRTESWKSTTPTTTCWQPT